MQAGHKSRFFTRKTVKRIFSDGFLGKLGFGETALAVAGAGLAWALWYLCWFLFRKKIFFSKYEKKAHGGSCRAPFIFSKENC